jgi:hypothetical protein
MEKTKAFFKVILKILEFLIYIGVFLVLLFLGYVAILTSDTLYVIIILITASLMFYNFSKIYNGSRKIMSLYFQEGSFFYNFFNKKSIITIFLAIIASLFLSTTMYGIAILMIKESPLLFIFSSSLSITVIVLLINRRAKSKMFEKNIVGPVSEHLFTLFELFYFTLIINILISLIYTYQDYYAFFTNHIDVYNFTDYALHNSINKNIYNGNETNDIVRKMFNLFILLDYFKQALGNTIINIFFEKENINKIVLTIVIFILDFIKYFSFSLALVIIVQSLHNKVMFISKLFISFINKLKTNKRKEKE